MYFKFTTSGESHGKALVAIVEGLPGGLPIDVAAINHELWRRQQGYGRGGRMKIETDTVEILSGVRHGKTLGSPIALMIINDDFIHWQEVMSSQELRTQPKNPRLVTRPRPAKRLPASPAGRSQNSFSRALASRSAVTSSSLAAYLPSRSNALGIRSN